MKWVMVLALVACGGKKEDKPPPVTGDVSAVVAKSTTPLEEARQILTTKTKRDAGAWVALAHAQAVAKKPEAKATLEAAVSAARTDVNGAQALALAVDVAIALGDTDGAAKLLDDALEQLKKEGADDIGVLMSPIVDVQHAPILERAAKLVDHQSIGEVAGRARTKTPAWTALLSHVRAGDSAKGEMLTAMARAARQSGDVATAKELANEAAQLALKDPFQDDVAIALELALVGDVALIKKLTDPVAKAQHSEEAAVRAIVFAQLAEIYAIAGDAATSKAFEKKALIAADAGSEELEEEDMGSKVGDPLWISLVVARAKRKEDAGALALVREHLSGEAVGEALFGLVEANAPELYDRVLGLMQGEAAFDAIASIVEVEARRDLEGAEKRALAGPRLRGDVAGAEHVLRGYALAGNLEAVRRLAAKDKGALASMQLDVFTDLAARSLARHGKCDEAVAATKEVVVNRGECLAVVARYCLNSKM